MGNKGMGRNPRRFWKKISRMQRDNSFLSYVLLLLSMLFWGTSYVFTSIVLKYWEPISIILIRLLLSAVMLWICIVLFCKKEKISITTLKWIGLLAFFEPFIYFIGETYGLQRVSPVITSLIISTIPVFTAITMTTFFHQRLARVNFIGIFISLAGVVLMIVGKNMQLNVDMLGLLFLLIALFSAVGYGIILNKLAAKVHPVWLIAIQNTFGVLFFLPLYFVLGTSPHFNQEPTLAFLTPVSEMWIILFILSMFSSSAAFIFYSISVQKRGITRCNVFTNLIPVFTLITSYLLLGEQFTLKKITGSIIIIFGLLLTQLNRPHLGVES
jgi:drug/metabolite transporter (DMT)-like permease